MRLSRTPLRSCATDVRHSAPKSSAVRSAAPRLGSIPQRKQTSARYTLPMPAITLWSSNTAPIGARLRCARRVNSAGEARRRKGSGPMVATIRPRSTGSTSAQTIGPVRSHAVVASGDVSRSLVASLGRRWVGPRRNFPMRPRCTDSVSPVDQSRNNCLPKASARSNVAPSSRAALSKKRPCGDDAPTATPRRSRARSRARRWMV